MALSPLESRGHPLCHLAPVQTTGVLRRNRDAQLFGMFSRKPPIRDARELSDFIDENAAFLVQKGIYEYSSAWAGHYAKVLFAEKTFSKGVEESCWRVPSDSQWSQR